MNSTQDADSGLSMIELIVTIVLIGILGAIVAMIFANSWRAQGAVTTTSQATNQGQLAGQAIERAVRDADAIAYSSDGTYLATRVPNGDGTYACRAFWVRSDSGGGSLVISAAQPVPTMTTGVWSNPLIDSRVVQINTSTPYFAPVASAAVTIGYQFNIVTDAKPVTISGQVSTRNSVVIVSTDSSHQGAAPCWT